MNQPTPKLRILPAGGCGEIGKNMTIIEYGDEILVVDAGIMFPHNDMLGIDYIIPDYKYLFDRRDHVKGVLITHGHEDHIGAIGHLMAEIGAPIFATRLTIGLLQVKLREAKLLDDVHLREIQAGEAFAVGAFLVEPFHVTHSIPDCVGFGITTPAGLIVHTGDYKFDYTPLDNWPPDFAKLAEFSARGVLCLLADSTNAETPGWTRSEKDLQAAFDRVFAQSSGRIMVVTFASLISRIQLVAQMAQKYGRKLAITGRSMRENTKTARALGYLDIPDDLLIDIDQAKDMPPSKVTIMATGSQGEPTAVLGRLAFGRHRSLSIESGDTIILSAHTIPGNEEMIHRIVNRLFQQGAHVLYEENADIHVSGHCAQEEMKLMINLVRPRFFIPIHGELRHLQAHGKLAESLGIATRNIAVIENGTIIELDQDGMNICERLPGGYIFVDGASVGEIGWSVMRDRDRLAQNGFFMAIFGVNDRCQLVGKPELITRGFTSKDQLEEIREGVEEALVTALEIYGDDRKQLENRVGDSLGRFLYAETGRRPLVYAVIR